MSLKDIKNRQNNPKIEVADFSLADLRSTSVERVEEIWIMPFGEIPKNGGIDKIVLDVLKFDPEGKNSCWQEDEDRKRRPFQPTEIRYLSSKMYSSQYDPSQNTKAGDEVDMRTISLYGFALAYNGTPDDKMHYERIERQNGLPIPTGEKVEIMRILCRRGSASTDTDGIVLLPGVGTGRHGVPVALKSTVDAIRNPSAALDVRNYTFDYKALPYGQEFERLLMKPLQLHKEIGAAALTRFMKEDEIPTTSNSNTRQPNAGTSNVVGSINRALAATTGGIAASNPLGRDVGALEPVVG